MPETVTFTYTRGTKTFTASVVVSDQTQTVAPGWQRTKSNTGLAAVGVAVSQLTNYTGPLVVPAGTRLYRQNINIGGNRLELGSGVALEQCQVTSSRISSQGAIYIPGGKNQKIINTDIILTGTNGEIAGVYAAAADGILIQSVYETGGSIGMWIDTVPGAATTLVDQWMYGNQPTGGGAHRDGFTRRAGNVMITVQNSSIDIVKDSATGAVFTQPTWGGTVGGITFSNNRLTGAGYVIGLDHGYDSHFFNNRIYSNEWGVASIVKSAYTGAWDWIGNYSYTSIDNLNSNIKGILLSDPRS